MKSPLLWMLRCTLTLMGLSLITLQAHAANYYRYVNESGSVVIDDNVPPQYVAKGYDVLSSSGRVLEVVPPHTVPSGTGDNSGADKKTDAVQRQEDSMLLRSYSSLTELEAARDRRLASIEKELVIGRKNRAESLNQLNAMRTRGANLQRQGKKLPKELLETISGLKSNLTDSDQMQRVREAEYQAISAKYSRYSERFVVLKGVEPVQAPPVPSDEKNLSSSPAIDPASSR